jgi:hypothetical protein
MAVQLGWNHHVSFKSAKELDTEKLSRDDLDLKVRYRTTSQRSMQEWLEDLRSRLVIQDDEFRARHYARFGAENEDSNNEEDDEGENGNSEEDNESDSDIDSVESAIDEDVDMAGEDADAND